MRTITSRSKSPAMVVEPSVAIVARFIDDDGQSANSDRAEAIDCVVDKGSSADRRHRFADAIPISPQAAPEARGDDAPMSSAEVETSVTSGPSRVRRARLSQRERVAPRRASFGVPDILRRNPDEADAHAPSALAVPAE